MINKNDLNTEIEILNNKRYCVLKLDDDDRIVDFEINMIKNNPALSFLEMEVVQRDRERKILYNLESKKSFSEFTQREDGDIGAIIEILEYIYKCLNNIKDYMLDNRRVILNPKYIFIDNNLVAYMLYLTLETNEECNVQKEFNSLCENINKEIKKYDYNLTNNDKKVMNRLSSNRGDFNSISNVFLDYRKRKEEEKLLEKPKKKDEVLNVDIDKDEISNTENLNEKGSKKKDVKKVYKSIIEEDYSKFKDFEEDEELEDYFEEELEYKEYKEIDSYGKKIDSEGKNKSIVIIQLIVLMLLGSLGLIISYDDKKIFIGIAISMAVVIVIFTFLIFSSSEKKKGN